MDLKAPDWARAPGTAGERTHYNRFYANGGWSYIRDLERTWLRERVLTPLNLRPPGRVLDIGCGTGIHSALWHEAGFQVSGVDVSDVGIAAARRSHPGPTFVSADLADYLAQVPRAHLDVVFARGMTWYHYELDGINEDGVDVPAATGRLFARLRPGGVFVLQISTDFSGSNRGQGGVHFNRLSAYRHLFEQFGSVVLLTNWSGRALGSDEQARRIGGNVLIATTRGLR